MQRKREKKKKKKRNTQTEKMPPPGNKMVHIYLCVAMRHLAYIEIGGAGK